MLLLLALNCLWINELKSRGINRTNRCDLNKASRRINRRSFVDKGKSLIDYWGILYDDTGITLDEIKDVRNDITHRGKYSKEGDDVGKDLTISGISIDNATSNCQVSVIVNNVKPYQPANPAGAAGDYSKWNFGLTSKYTTIKQGENRITAKYECPNNPASKAFSSVNVTGVQK